MTDMPTSIVQRIIDRGPMTRFQIVAVGICMAMNLIDGFDVLAISFAGPLLAEDWSLTPDQLGLLFSSGLAGMTLGSALVAPLADRLGRRWMTLFSLALVTVGMMASAMAASHLQMAVLRFVTGLGIGATLGRTAALFIIAAFGWRGIFVFGAALSALARANHLLERLGHETLTVLPQPVVHEREPGLRSRAGCC